MSITLDIATAARIHDLLELDLAEARNFDKEEDAAEIERLCTALMPERDPKLAAYEASAGTTCPHCQSQDIEGGFVDIDGNQAYQEVGCQACHAQWRDVYRFSTFEPVTQ